jgi:iron complex outermembrane recepter protein
LQVQSLLSPGNTFVGNAQSAQLKGLELETIVRPFTELTLTSNVSLLRAVYGPFLNASVATGILPFVLANPLYNRTTTFFDATGDTLSDAPRFSAFEAAQGPPAPAARVAAALSIRRRQLAQVVRR